MKLYLGTILRKLLVEEYYEILKFSGLIEIATKGGIQIGGITLLTKILLIMKKCSICD
ncbi:hypothetical protein IFVP182_C260262 [Vibrio parahaemolyticus]